MSRLNNARIMVLESAIILIALLLIVIGLLNYKIIVYDEDSALLEYVQHEFVIDKTIKDGIHINLKKSLDFKGKTITIKYNFAAIPDTNSIWYLQKNKVTKW